MPGVLTLGLQTPLGPSAPELPAEPGASVLNLTSLLQGLHPPWADQTRPRSEFFVTEESACADSPPKCALTMHDAH